jgi:hypothetical protein
VRLPLLNIYQERKALHRRFLGPHINLPAMWRAATAAELRFARSGFVITYIFVDTREVGCPRIAVSRDVTLHSLVDG